MNGSDHQSTVLGVTGGGTNARDSLMSELESPTTPGRAAGGDGNNRQPTIVEQPFELAGEEAKK